MFALALRDCFVHLFQKWCPTHSGAGQGRVALGSAFLFGNFFFALVLSKKKWVKKLKCLKIVYLCNAFFFAIIGTKKKAWQKRNAVALKPRGSATRRAPPFEKGGRKHSLWCGASHC